MQRIGLLTSGGDCQGLNTALRAIAKVLYVANPEIELVGFNDGFAGLLNADCRIMQHADFSGIMTIGGTILGSSRRSFQQVHWDNDKDNTENEQLIAVIKNNFEQLKLSGLVVLGGHGSQAMAKALIRNGLPVLTLPMTINNDIAGSDVSIGFLSASQIISTVIDSIHSTATSHGRVFIIETMGHDSGWLALNGGLAGGADVILIPELPYNINLVAQAIELRQLRQKRYTIIVVAEGAVSIEENTLAKDALQKLRATWPCQSVAWHLAEELGQIVNQEIRVTVPGHFQRGGSPNSCDRVLATLLGTQIAQKIIDNEYGYLIGIKDDQVKPVLLVEQPDQPRLVPLDSPRVIAGRAMGLSFGDAPPV